MGDLIKYMLKIKMLKLYIGLAASIFSMYFTVYNLNKCCVSQNIVKAMEDESEGEISVKEVFNKNSEEIKENNKDFFSSLISKFNDVLNLEDSKSIRNICKSIREKKLYCFNNEESLKNSEEKLSNGKEGSFVELAKLNPKKYLLEDINKVHYINSILLKHFDWLYSCSRDELLSSNVDIYLNDVKGVLETLLNVECFDDESNRKIIYVYSATVKFNNDIKAEIKKFDDDLGIVNSFCEKYESINSKNLDILLKYVCVLKEYLKKVDTFTQKIAESISSKFGKILNNELDDRNLGGCLCNSNISNVFAINNNIEEEKLIDLDNFFKFKFSSPLNNELLGNDFLVLSRSFFKIFRNVNNKDYVNLLNKNLNRFYYDILCYINRSKCKDDGNVIKVKENLLVLHNAINSFLDLGDIDGLGYIGKLAKEYNESLEILDKGPSNENDKGKICSILSTISDLAKRIEKIEYDLTKSFEVLKNFVIKEKELKEKDFFYFFGICDASAWNCYLECWSRYILTIAKVIMHKYDKILGYLPVGECISNKRYDEFKEFIKDSNEYKKFISSEFNIDFNNFTAEKFSDLKESANSVINLVFSYSKKHSDVKCKDWYKKSLDYFSDFANVCVSLYSFIEDKIKNKDAFSEIHTSIISGLFADMSKSESIFINYCYKNFGYAPDIVYSRDAILSITKDKTCSGCASEAILYLLRTIMCFMRYFMSGSLNNVAKEYVKYIIGYSNFKEKFSCNEGLEKYFIIKLDEAINKCAEYIVVNILCNINNLFNYYCGVLTDVILSFQHRISKNEVFCYGFKDICCSDIDYIKLFFNNLSKDLKKQKLESKNEEHKITQDEHLLNQALLIFGNINYDNTDFCNEDTFGSLFDESCFRYYLEKYKEYLDAQESKGTLKVYLENKEMCKKLMESVKEEIFVRDILKGLGYGMCLSIINSEESLDFCTLRDKNCINYIVSSSTLNIHNKYKKFIEDMFEKCCKDKSVSMRIFKKLKNKLASYGKSMQFFESDFFVFKLVAILEWELRNGCELKSYLDDGSFIKFAGELRSNHGVLSGSTLSAFPKDLKCFFKNKPSNKKLSDESLIKEFLRILNLEVGEKESLIYRLRDRFFVSNLVSKLRCILPEESIFKSCIINISNIADKILNGWSEIEKSLYGVRIPISYATDLCNDFEVLCYFYSDENKEKLIEQLANVLRKGKLKKDRYVGDIVFKFSKPLNIVNTHCFNNINYKRKPTSFKGVIDNYVEYVKNFNDSKGLKLNKRNIVLGLDLKCVSNLVEVMSNFSKFVSEGGFDSIFAKFLSSHVGYLTSPEESENDNETKRWKPKF